MDPKKRPDNHEGYVVCSCFYELPNPPLISSVQGENIVQTLSQVFAWSAL